MRIKFLLEVQMNLPEFNEDDLRNELEIEANDIQDMEHFRFLEDESYSMTTSIVKSEVMSNENK